MEEIAKAAQELGAKIKENPRYVELRKTESAVQNDEEAHNLAKSFEELSIKIREKEQKLQPVEPEEKKRLNEIREQCSKNEKLVQLMNAQVAYSELIMKVNEGIFGQLQARNDENAEQEKE